MITSKKDPLNGLLQKKQFQLNSCNFDSFIDCFNVLPLLEAESTQTGFNFRLSQVFVFIFAISTELIPLIKFQIYSFLLAEVFLGNPQQFSTLHFNACRLEMQNCVSTEVSSQFQFRFLFFSINGFFYIKLSIAKISPIPFSTSKSYGEKLAKKFNCFCDFETHLAQSLFFRNG